MSVLGYEQPYLEGLRTVAEGRQGQDHLLVLFLGSTIGNFDRDAGEEFLRETREILRPGDALLLGTDLEKSVELQLLAYDDPTGVTEAFNLNLLAARINRNCWRILIELLPARGEVEFGRPPDRDAPAVNVPAKSGILAAGLRVMLDEDETIWTESSHKYRAEEIPEMAVRAGFRCEGQWIDEEWPFSQNLLIAE